MTDLYGAELGGPYTGAVYQNRLVLAGSAVVSDLMVVSQTQTVWDTATPNFSRGTVNNNVLETVATDGFWFQQVSGRANTFHAIVQQEGMFLFGDLGEAVIPPVAFIAGEGSEVSIRVNSEYGSDRGRLPLIISGQVIFIQEGGADIRGFRFDEIQRKYIAPSLITKAGQPFQRARDLTFTPSQGPKGDTLYIPDDAGEGDMAVAVLKPDTDYPIAWSRWRTDGRFLGGAAPLGNQVFLVERNGEVGIEFPDPDAGTPEERYFDASRFVDADPGLEPNATETSRQVGDQARWEVGRPFERVVETLPFVARSQSGTRRSVTRSRIMQVALDMVPYPGVSATQRTANDRVPNDVRLKVGKKDKTMRPKLGEQVTGDHIQLRYGGRSGWRYRSSIRFTFTEPLQIAGLSYMATG